MRSVAVIVPCGAVSWMVASAFMRCVFMQDTDDFDVVMFRDAGPRVEDKTGRLILVGESDVPVGSGTARNRCLDYVIGAGYEYFMFADIDDVMGIRTISTLLRACSLDYAQGASWFTMPVDAFGPAAWANRMIDCAGGNPADFGAHRVRGACRRYEHHCGGTLVNAIFRASDVVGGIRFREGLNRGQDWLYTMTLAMALMESGGRGTIVDDGWMCSYTYFALTAANQNKKYAGRPNVWDVELRKNRAMYKSMLDARRIYTPGWEAHG